MSKSIYKLKTPLKCSECIFGQEEYNGCKDEYFCKIDYDVMSEEDFFTKIHPECPLRELPSKEEMTNVLEKLANFIVYEEKNTGYIENVLMSNHEEINYIQDFIKLIYGDDN